MFAWLYSWLHLMALLWILLVFPALVVCFMESDSVRLGLFVLLILGTWLWWWSYGWVRNTVVTDTAKHAPWSREAWRLPSVVMAFVVTLPPKALGCARWTTQVSCKWVRTTIANMALVLRCVQGSPLLSGWLRAYCLVARGIWLCWGSFEFWVLGSWFCCRSYGWVRRTTIATVAALHAP